MKLKTNFTWVCGTKQTPAGSRVQSAACAEIARLKAREKKLVGLLEERLQWDKYWFGVYPETLLGQEGAFSLEHWQIKIKAALAALEASDET
jgi:hypothetical protein